MEDKISKYHNMKSVHLIKEMYAYIFLTSFLLPLHRLENTALHLTFSFQIYHRTNPLFLGLVFISSMRSCIYVLYSLTDIPFCLTYIFTKLIFLSNIRVHSFAFLLSSLYRATFYSSAFLRQEKRKRQTTPSRYSLPMKYLK